VTPAWTLDADGMMPVPIDRPGIGVDVDEGWIEDLTVMRETIDAR
jgi:hypothetical protein